MCLVSTMNAPVEARAVMVADWRRRERRVGILVVLRLWLAV